MTSPSIDRIINLRVISVNILYSYRPDHSSPRAISVKILKGVIVCETESTQHFHHSPATQHPASLNEGAHAWEHTVWSVMRREA